MPSSNIYSTQPKSPIRQNGELIKPLFSTGQIVATPGALALLGREGIPPVALLRKHVTGDWGECGKDDTQANVEALQLSLRIFSVYSVGKGKVWVITEADRSSTTLLLPEEY